LPLAESAELGRLTGVLSAFAAGLLARADEIRGRRQHPVSRKEAILNFVELHAASSVTLQGLAAALHLSPSRTSHLVRELTGRSFKELVVAERLRRAQGLLRSTDLTVAEVGRLVGVPNVCHFSRLFRAKMGVPPGSYRADGPLPENRPDVPD
jgi:transcriptional regulator GlxA family with amidase domain